MEHTQKDGPTGEAVTKEAVVDLGAAAELTDNARGNAAEGNRGRT